MALVISGKTPCSLCGKLIEQGQGVTGFPAFLGSLHPLSRYSDAVFHTACFLSCPDRDAVAALFSRYQEIWSNRPQNLKSASEIEAWGKQAFKDFA